MYGIKTKQELWSSQNFKALFFWYLNTFIITLFIHPNITWRAREFEVSFELLKVVFWKITISFFLIATVVASYLKQGEDPRNNRQKEKVPRKKCTNFCFTSLKWNNDVFFSKNVTSHTIKNRCCTKMSEDINLLKNILNLLIKYQFTGACLGDFINIVPKVQARSKFSLLQLNVLKYMN